MMVNIEINRKDLWKYFFYVNRWSLIVYMLILIIILIYVGSFYVEFSIFVFALAIVCFHAFFRRIISVMAMQPGCLGNRSIEITPKGIIGKDEFGEGFLKWRAISKIVIYRDYIFIFIGTNAQIIPKRAFSSDKECTNFFETAKSYWQKSSL